MSIRNKLILASRAHYDAHIRKHAMNVEVILSNPLALPEHTDLMDAIEKELKIVDEYQGKLDALNAHFKVEVVSVPKTEEVKDEDDDNKSGDTITADSISTTDTTTTTTQDASVVVGAGGHLTLQGPSITPV